jgi:Family of unknown function (DUF5989)
MAKGRIQPENTKEFAGQAEGRVGGFLSEFWYFLRHNKKWWLTPVLLLLLLLGVLVILGGSGAAPFIYTLF